MRNSHSSSWSAPIRAGRGRSSRLAEWVLVLGTAVSVMACGEEDDGITYGDDIAPLFNRRCTICHRPESISGVDIQNPFAPENGLVNQNNLWKEGHPEDNAALPDLLVQPGEPENSFLIHKIAGPESGLLPTNPNTAGEYMPLQIERLTDEEIAALEQWVLDGARNDEFFATMIQPIFGYEDPSRPGKCVHCHYPGTPDPPDLTDPFGPQGIVNVPARYRSRTLRIAPGDLEGSLLIAKVKAEVANSNIGAPMPYSYNPLSEAQVDLVRQWILEGARP